MKIEEFNLLLPVIFSVNNYEEYYFFSEFPKQYFRFVGIRFNDRGVFLYAIMILQIFVTVLIGINYFSNNEIYDVLLLIVNCSIVINILQHIVASFVFKKIVPGTRSALLLLTPYELIYFKSLRLDAPEILFYFSISFLIMPLFIYVSLWTGYFLKRIKTYE